MKKAALFVVALALGGAAQAQIIWDEASQGDLSNDRLAPTSLNLALGTNGVLARSGFSDIEYIHFHLASGMQLDAIVPISYSGNDEIAFIGVQAGTTFTEPANGANVANLLGWALWGPAMGSMNTNILPAIGTGAGAQGFTGPLTGSDYTFWIQNTGSDFTWRMDFNTSVVPEPTSIAALFIGSLAFLRKRQRS